MLKSFIRKNFGNSDANLSLEKFRKLTLDPLGWTRSVDKGESVDREGKPFPSCTSVFVKDGGPISKITFENSYFSLPEY